MISLNWRWLAAVLLVVALGAPTDSDAQYFGRNKVRYETFDFRIMRSDHFDTYFYPAESLAVADGVRMMERWYARLSDLFRHQFDRKSWVFYADHPDFQQTNVIGGQIPEGVGGVTEGFRTRVVMPFTGSYWEDDHVVGHELVHVFQYNIAEQGPGGLNRMAALPGWLIEGMAEYLSLGRSDAPTAMWLRDATLRDKLPTLKQLNTDPRYFPYRYGQALWAYVGGRWGDRAVVDIYRTALRLGWEQSIVRVLGMTTDSLSKDWIASIKSQYEPAMADRTRPADVGNQLIAVSRSGGDYNVSPSVSPDGRYLAFYSSRDLFGIDLYVADAVTGRVIRRLASPTSNRHFDAITFLSSSGAWSPDGGQFAFIAQAQGNHEIAILNVADARVVRRVQVPGVGAINNVSWSPDGRTIAFSGMSGGLSDLYLVDVEGQTVRQLTNDRHADLHPTWSPDGRSLAFITDRGPETNFQTLTYSSLLLGVIDVATAQITVHAPFPRARHINPQYSPDGSDIYFVADPDGFSDIYRLTLSTGAVHRITRVATGVAGISRTSPAISMAKSTGALFFTVFDNQGHSVVSLPADRLVGTPVIAGAEPQVVDGALLPPNDTPVRSPIANYLADATTGLPAQTEFQILPYRPRFSLDMLGQPSVGVTTGGPFGTGVAGGVFALFGDQLGDQVIGTAIQANGQLQDIAAEIHYLNLRRRLNWGVGLQHIPYLTGFVTAEATSRPDRILYKQYLQRIFYDQGSLLAQYPFSTTRRVEFSLAATRIGFSQQVDAIVADQLGNIYDRQLSDEPSPPAVHFGQASLAFVGDNSAAAFTSPVRGERYRLEVQPTFGELAFTSGVVDYRRYVLARPVTFAFRGLHYGRYGPDSENYDRVYPLYLGEETLIRGYAFNSFRVSECGESGGGRCPAFERLVGSRLAVFNAELRIPLIGNQQWGLISIPFLPVEVAPFFDAGLMWTSDQPPQFRLDQTADSVPPSCNQASRDRGMCAERIPVFSTGVSFRVNLLGYMIVETYIAKPFQRPARSWVWGVQLAPGW
jgi:Tol biopolymer transport system component